MAANTTNDDLNVDVVPRQLIKSYVYSVYELVRGWQLVL